MKSIIPLLALCFVSTFTLAQKRGSLEGKKITTVELHADISGSVKPGSRVNIGAVANAAKESFSTVGLLAGKTNWENFDVRVRGGSFHNGTVHVASDPDSFVQHRVFVFVYNVFDTAKSASLSWSVDYDQDYTLDFNGAHGAPGADGPGGNAGSSSGETRSGDARPGATGGAGRNGRNGADGADGADILVQAWTEQRPELNATMLRLRVTNRKTGSSSSYMAYAEKNTFDILANGGNGGDGGRGGNGGGGGNGGTGGFALSSTTADGRHKVDAIAGKGGDGGGGGNGANGGNGGNGGRGGNVELIIDPSAKEFVGNIRIHNRGGAPGKYGDAGARGNGGKFGEGGAGRGLLGQAGVNGLKGAMANPDRTGRNRRSL